MDGFNPLTLFPLNVWEMILDKVGHSETVYSVLKMFPQLDLELQSKKHKWLLGKILPFVTTWTGLVEEGDLVKCRLGCLNWIQQVDNFLENQQPQLRPYHPDLQSDDHFEWNSKAQFEHYGKDPEEHNKNSFYGGVKFDLYEDDDAVGKFLKKMGPGAYPEERNPFLARSLSVKLGYDYDETHRQNQEVEFLDKVMQVQERFGKHIWFYSVSLEIKPQLVPLLWDWLTHSLALLPNLKGLEVSVSVLLLTDGYGGRSSKNTKKNIKGMKAGKAFKLPFLESIRVCDPDSETFAERLLSKITAPIRRLELNFAYWKKDYSRLLSTLTEFKLEGIRMGKDGDWTSLRKFLSSLEAPQLVKLELKIEMESGKKHRPTFLEDDIFQWIKRFPSLKYFDIGGYDSECWGNRNFISIQEKGTLLPERDSLPNLQFLSMWDSSALSYNFLRCLPSLKHLRIYSESYEKVVDLSNEKVVKIREQIETGTMHKSNVWEVMPSLRSVTIWSDDRKFACDREKYNYCKEHPEYEGFKDFRDDYVSTHKLNTMRFPRSAGDSDFDSNDDDDLGGNGDADSDSDPGLW